LGKKKKNNFNLQRIRRKYIKKRIKIRIEREQLKRKELRQEYEEGLEDIKDYNLDEDLSIDDETNQEAHAIR
jgi:hypothetical protein